MRSIATDVALSPYLFNILAEMVMRETLDGFQGGLKIGGRMITNLRYADDIILLTTSEAEPWYSIVFSCCCCCCSWINFILIWPENANTGWPKKRSELSHGVMQQSKWNESAEKHVCNEQTSSNMSINFHLKRSSHTCFSADSFHLLCRITPCESSGRFFGPPGICWKNLNIDDVGTSSYNTE